MKVPHTSLFYLETRSQTLLKTILWATISNCFQIYILEIKVKMFYDLKIIHLFGTKWKYIEKRKLFLSKKNQRMVWKAKVAVAKKIVFENKST